MKDCFIYINSLLAIFYCKIEVLTRRLNSTPNNDEGVSSWLKLRSRVRFRQIHEHPLSQERSFALVLLRKIYANCRNFDLLWSACSTSLIGGILWPDRRIEVKRGTVLKGTVGTSGNKQRMGRRFLFGSINGYSCVCTCDRKIERKRIIKDIR